nr:hypothetical protein [Actinomycetota bacterium]
TLAWLSATAVAATAGPVRRLLRHPRAVPAELLPRRRDSVEVVGAALAAHARGKGHRVIAAELGLPASTVRN